MLLSRRTVLAGAGVLGLGIAGFAARPILWPRSGTDTQALKIPPLLDPRASGGSASLRVQTGTTEFYPGRFSETLGYNGSYLGPTIRVRRGDSVQFNVKNELAETTTVHWHGLLVPGPLDGGPHQPISPGQTWRPLLPIDQPAATLMYHSHVHGLTAEQVYRGLAGVFIIQDDEEQRLGLPNDYGVDDLPLVLQDRQFEDGLLVMPNGMMTLMQGRRGDIVLVNGTPNPVAQVPPRLVRLRMVNASNARVYDLSFEDKRAFHWIATEGGLLERPVQLQSIRLAPGQRAELLVDFSDRSPVGLLTTADSNSRIMGMMPMMQDFGRDRVAGGAFIRFEPGAAASGAASVPKLLIAQERVQPSAAIRRRRLVLNMGMGGMMGGGMMEEQMSGDTRTEAGPMAAPFSINGRPFDMRRIDESVTLGNTEIWEVSGEMMAHPLHIHGVHFEVLSRAGRKPDVLDQGLRDTVLVREPAELLVKFSKASQGYPFMYHCHILEHEDNGMMGQFSVE
ncbi:multicopper oxidase [Streptomyces purpurogeneiscleroticus]|nr:multicopper oxidase [Streptomyces purpurogeneiscleroticus]